MRLPPIAGVIERRLLVNYRVDPDVIAALLPKPFRPQVVGDWAVAGICLIRLGQLRPRGVPRWAGLRSENAAHRIAVEWDENGATHSGVYIPRRDSDSFANVALGGRVYPGEHHRARFRVQETATDLKVGFTSTDAAVAVDVDVQIAARLIGSALFADVSQASRFFEHGSTGFAATRDANRFDGLELETADWQVEPGAVESARSSFFDDPVRFPPGTAELDCALVMRQVVVAWKPLPALRAEPKWAA